MTRVLITDACKSSLVMTSEVFKDRLPGVSIDIASHGKDSLEILTNSEEPYDMIVVDFDLPDTDGVTLSHFLRRYYSGPILLTAFPDRVVNDAIDKEVFLYHDTSMWVPKPVKFENLVKKIEIFLIGKKRLKKRFQTDLSAMLVGKGAGRGKRAPKAKGQIINLGIGGAQVSLADALKMRVGDEVMVSLNLPVVGNKEPIDKVNLNKCKLGVSKLKAKICWTDNKKNVAGIEFDKLTEVNKRAIEAILRDSELIDIV